MALKAIIFIVIGIAFVVFAGLMVMGFYFTVMSPPGQQFLIGGFEGVAASFYQFISAPFQGLTEWIKNFFAHPFGLMIGSIFLRKRKDSWVYRKVQRVASLFLGRRTWRAV